MNSRQATNSSAIHVSGLGKKYRLKQHGQATVKSSVLSLFGARVTRQDFWALRGVSFEVRRGETLGIIGRNGAGKSTLLGLITGTISPTEGAVRTAGRISSLLELGAGFHPDLTGRENIFLNGSILGLTKKEIRQRFDAIVSFSELEQFIDMPVKYYSSGMFVRLGFSVAMEVDPEILIVDEVLSVGDEEFQKKCLARIHGLKERAKTLLIVSHDMETIQKMCHRTLLLNRGVTVVLDTPGRAIHEYRNIGLYDTEKTAVETRDWGTREAEIAGVQFFNRDGRETREFSSHEDLVSRIRYRARRRLLNPIFGFAVTAADGRVVYGSNTEIEKYEIPFIEGEGALELAMTPLPLVRGKFFFSFSIHSADHRTNFHRLDNQFDISVIPCGGEEGFVKMPVRWRTPKGS